MNGGFTLIELLVVISIIAILAGLLLPVISSVMNNAHKTEAKSTEMQIVAAVNNYYTEYGQYPVEAPAGGTPVDVTFDNTAITSPSAPSSGLYGHNLILFNVLRASNSTSGDATYEGLNSRQIVYFESKDVKNVGNARSGFIPTGATSVKGNPKNTNVVPSVGDLVDPWGNLYYVRIDGNYTGMLENPYNSGTDSGNSITYNPSATDSPSTAPGSINYAQVLRTTVVSWSPGLDGYMGVSSGSTGTFSPTSAGVGDDVLSWQ
jgi:prepilin-type N-terminal cleavage/methylation domain-containing protein